MVLRQLGPGETSGRYDYGQRHIVCLIFYLSLPSPFLSTYPIIYCIKKITNYKKSLAPFIKVAKQMDFTRPVFAIAVLQEPFSLLTDWLSHTFHIVSYFTCHLSGVSIFLEGLHPLLKGTLYRIQMREVQSQGIHPLALWCTGLIKVRTMWSTVDPMQTPLDIRSEIQGLFVS